MKFLIRRNFCSIRDYVERKDHMISGFFSDGMARFVISDITQTLNKKFNFNNEKKEELNIAFNTSLIMNSFLEGEERVKLICQYVKNKNLNTIYAESICTGEVRGFLEEEKINEKWDKNYIKISKILYNHTEEVYGIIKLEGDRLVEDDIFNYFDNSEQIRTRVYFRNKPDLALGFILQKMPGCEDSELEYRFEKILQNKNFGKILNEGLTYSDFSNIFKDLNMQVEGFRRTPIQYFCRCSRDQFYQVLKQLGKDNLVDMKKKQHNKITCKNCNKQYELSEKDFDDLINTII
jgi:molecular chaperone Hsp33